MVVTWGSDIHPARTSGDEVPMIVNRGGLVHPPSDL